MRENRPSGSEGGGAESKQPSLPLSKERRGIGLLELARPRLTQR